MVTEMALVVMKGQGEYCPVCGKQCFNTKGEAQKAMRNMDKKSAKNGAVYFCPECQKWHTTHWSYQKSKLIRQVKEKEVMAGTGKFKIGAELRFKDDLGAPLRCGDYVRHIITGKEGTITQYGVIKGEDGTNYKLCDYIWKVLQRPFKDEIKQMVPITPSVGEEEKKEKDSDEEGVNTIDNGTEDAAAEKEAVACESSLADFNDQALADELRNRGFEVKAEKIVVLSL